MLGNLFKYEKSDSITAKGMSLLPHIKTFHDTYTFLQKSQWWSREKLEEYQMRQLSKLLHHAYENVPYYRKVFNERGSKPKDIQDFNDLQKLPFLTKEIIRDNLSNLKATNYSQGKLEYVTTAGSTGVPLGLYYERGVSRAQEWAFIKTQWDRVGYRFRDKCVVLRDNIVKSANEGEFWEYALFGRWLVLSSYHMTDENLPKYIEKIRKFKPKFIQAYPSAITILARFIRENDVEPFATVKAILCSSENLYLWQRELLEEVFRCQVYSFYGHTERVVLAGECEKSIYYHIFPEYGFVEPIGKDSKPVANQGEIGEIVATGFTNFAMPLIRYRTADLGIYAGYGCRCGRNYPLIKSVEGRLQEFIVANDGSLVSLGSIIGGIHEAEWAKVRQTQFFQEIPGKLVIKVVKDPSYYNAEVEADVLALFKARLGNQFILDVKFVDYFPCSQRGKHKFLIQKLPIEFENIVSK